MNQHATLLLFAALLSVPATAASIDNVWVARGPYGGDVLCLALDPSDPRRVYVGTTSGGVFAITQAAGLAADFDGNGVVDFDDFFLFASTFGKKRGDVGFEAKYDLSDNGEVDFSDFFIFAERFGR